MKRRCLLCLGLVVCLAVATPLLAAKAASTVTIVNKSDWTVVELYLSPSDHEEWGPDQLEEEVLETGGRLTLTNVPCDVWDLRVVDEDGDVCILTEVELCAHDAGWLLTNDELLACEANTEEE